MNGYKTYIVAILIVIASLAKWKGYIDQGTLEIVLALLGGTGLATLRAGVKKSRGE